MRIGFGAAKPKRPFHQRSLPRAHEVSHSQLSSFVRSTGERNVRILLRFGAALVGMVTVFSVLFHFLMAVEGRHYSWLTGFYWTLTVMSTLGFGDITFTSDLGRAFTSVVLLSGMIFLLILLPFTFIEFFYAPWMKAEAEARAPRQLPEGTSGHVILTAYDPVTRSLMRKLDDYGYSYVVVVGDLQEALRLHRSRRARALLEKSTARNLSPGAPNKPPWSPPRAMTSSMNIAFTIREPTNRVPIVTTADSQDSVGHPDARGQLARSPTR